MFKRDKTLRILNRARFTCNMNMKTTPDKIRTVTVLLTALLLTQVPARADKHATDTAVVDADTLQQPAEYEASLTAPLLPPPLAEASEVPQKPRKKTSYVDRLTPAEKIEHEKRVAEAQRLIRYFRARNELESLKPDLSSAEYIRRLEAFYRSENTSGGERYLPNSASPESVTAHLEAARKKQAREECHKILRTVADALDRYLSDNPDARIRHFGEDDIKILYQKGYLSRSVKMPKNCSYVNDSRLSEVFSGRDIYCTEHGTPED